MNENSKVPEVTFKYYMPENSEEIWLHIHAQDMYALLWDLDQKCRSVIKYEDSASEDKIVFAEYLRQTIRESIDMDKIS